MPQRRSTRQRQLVLDVVRALHDHPTADQVYARARQQDPRISRGTVYRNLALLAQDGQLLSVPIGGVTHYDDNMGPHAHVTCSSCGTVMDVAISRQDLDRACADVMALTGYSGLDAQITFTGLCPACKALEESGQIGA